MVTRQVTKGVTKIWLLAWFSGRKSTKNHEIAYMQGARARVHLHACQKKFNRLSADDPVYILGVVCCMFPGRTENEILLLHAFCSKNFVCTCISITYFRETFLISYALFSLQLQISYSCMVTPYGYWRVTIQVTTRY